MTRTRHCSTRGASALRLGLLMLAGALAAACGGHSPSEPAPKGDTLSVLSVTPPEGTAFAAGSPYHVQVVLQYHLADGPVADIRFAELRADGSPLLQPPIPIIVDFPFPLIRADGTFPFSDQGQLPKQNVGPEVLLRFSLYPKGSAVSTTSVTLHYAIAY
ncbi:MAG TPA: hypothetical protein VN999_09335 [Thermoanaerobaculia bacterium]|nr:hypothetical protein [Thermoanaerobaculia bacterium]